jgi:hypothetical protein
MKSGISAICRLIRDRAAPLSGEVPRLAPPPTASRATSGAIRVETLAAGIAVVGANNRNAALALLCAGCVQIHNCSLVG